MASSTRWRINIQGTSKAGALAVAEIEMRTTQGGANACVGGTASAGSVYPGYPASNCLDGNVNTFWAAFFTSVSWWEYEFASAVDIVEVSLRASTEGGRGSEMPREFTVEYHDGSAWQIAFTAFYPGIWGEGETRVYTFATSDKSAIQTKQAWRMRATNTQVGNGLSASELAWRTNPGGSNIAVGGLALTYTNAGNGGEWPSRAYDSNVSTYTAVYSSAVGWFGYVFSSTVEVIELEYRTRDGSPQQAVKSGYIEYWDQSEQTWVEAFEIPTQSDWSNLESRSFTFGIAPISRRPSMFVVM